MSTPRSYLFVTWEGGGNVLPVLGVARRLAARGHRVRVLAEPCMQEAVEAAGGHFIPFRRYFNRTDRTVDLIQDWDAGSSPKDVREGLDRLLFGPARGVAEETKEALEAEPTDVVAADVMMVGSLIAAEAAGVPRVVLFHMPEYLPGPGKPAAGAGFLPARGLPGRLRDRLFNTLFERLLRGFAPALNALRADFGLGPIESPLALYHEADRRLIQTSKAFDFPITPAPSNVRYVGPVLDEPDWAAPWQNPWEADDPRPLVVVGLGSTYQNQRGAIERTAAALGGLPVRGLVTLGPAMAGEKIEGPENVAVVATAPHGQVFPHADAVVTHAGHGTVMRALANGLPLVCLPMGRDQDDNAARVVARGAGLRLKPSASAEQIRTAIRRVLDEPAFREAARALGRVIVEDAAAERAVYELEAVGRTPARRAAASSVPVPVL